eukprot:scaffold10349_cov67-Phaeocystis_antarctica.AAC.2
MLQVYGRRLEACNKARRAGRRACEHRRFTARPSKGLWSTPPHPLSPRERLRPGWQTLPRARDASLPPRLKHRPSRPTRTRPMPC